MEGNPVLAGAGVGSEDTSERARNAVKTFRAMQPGLTSFARVLTGRRNVRVELAVGGPRTDGNRIMYRPPIRLGDKIPHDRSKCDIRDENLIQTCPSCEAREYVMIQIYHEISHIAFGSFDPVSDSDRKALLSRALDEYPSIYADKVKQRVESAPPHLKTSYLGMAGIISEFLPPLVNALEDCRIDDRMFSARRGTRKMFDAMTITTFRDGVEADDGSTWLWSDRPLNSQILVGVFAIGTGYEPDGWFSEKVETDLADERLRQLVAEAVASVNVATLYRRSFPVLARLRELGYCKTETDNDDVSEDDESDDDSGQDSSDSSDQSDDSDGDGSDSQADKQESDDDGSQSQGDSDEDDSQEVGDEEHDDDPSDRGDGGPEDDEAGPDGMDDVQDQQDVDAADSAGSDGDAESEQVPEDAGSDGDEGDDESGGDSSESEGSSGESDESQAEGDGGEGSGDGQGTGSSDGSDRGGNGGPSDEFPESAGSGSEDGVDGEGERVDGEEGDGDRSDREREGTEVDGDSDAERVPDQGGQTSADEGHGDAGTQAGPQGLPPTNESERSEGGNDGPSDVPQEEGSSDDGADASESEAIDTGADEGKGGAHSDYYGTPQEAVGDIEVVAHHGDIHDFDQHGDPGMTGNSEDEAAALDTAIVQGLYFEQPSANIGMINVFRPDEPLRNDDGYNGWRFVEESTFDLSDVRPDYLRQIGVDGSDAENVSEAVLGPATLEARRTFDDNMRADRQKNMRAGKVRPNVLGKRAWSGDDRLFGKKVQPTKRSYSVLIGIDISGSTSGQNIMLAKRAAWAQAELCGRVGIDFAVYAHTTGAHAYGDGYGEWSYSMDMYEIKSFDDDWTPVQQKALLNLAPCAGNLDGHSLEFYRHKVEQRPTTDQIILYYSDGKMPAANHDEELEVLQREIKYCRRVGITLLGVGIRTDSPARHGLDTVQVDNDEDMRQVVSHLGKRIRNDR